MGPKAGGLCAACAALLAFLLFAAGFLACAVLPPATAALAQQSYAQGTTSPFSAAQLGKVAEAARDYSFGTHDADALYRAVYQANAELAAKLQAQGAALPEGAPELSDVTQKSDAAQIAAAFEGASDVYVLSADAVAHLDDCHAVAVCAYLAIALALVAAIACLATLRRRGGRRRLGRALIAGGVLPLALVALFGLWAAVDFNGLFIAFHRLLFSGGNWSFPADSLLICALPEAFWVGMLFVWVGVTAATCACAIAVGALLAKQAHP